MIEDRVHSPENLIKSFRFFNEPEIDTNNGTVTLDGFPIDSVKMN